MTTISVQPSERSVAAQPTLPRWVPLASALLHLALALIVAVQSLLRQPLEVAAPPPPIEVQLINPQQLDELERPQQLPPPPPLPDVAPPESIAPPVPGLAPPPDDRLQSEPPPPVPRLDQIITARQFYSAEMLKEPGMQKIKASLQGFADADRVMQLCNIESLEQIKRADPGKDPDIMVSYAMHDVETQGLTLIATGGAYRSRRKWYGIQFRCTATPDLEGVSAFSFKLGAAVPEDQWDAHDLTAEDPELD